MSPVQDVGCRDQLEKWLASVPRELSWRSPGGLQEDTNRPRLPGHSPQLEISLLDSWAVSRLQGLSLVIPVKEPEPYLPELMTDARKVLDRTGLPYEVLIQREEGLTAAVLAGAMAARYPVLAVMDADGSHSPMDLFFMLDLVTRWPLVIGSKAMGLDMSPFSRRLISRVYRELARIVLGLTVTDPMSGYVMGRRDLFLDLEPDRGYKFLLQILVRHPGEEPIEFPIRFWPRFQGKSKASLITGLRTLLAIISLRSWRSSKFGETGVPV